VSTARVAIALPAGRSAFGPLAWIEAKRFARHPLFLTGFVLALLASGGEYGPVELDHGVVPAFFVGIFGLVVAARLTASTRRCEAIVDAAPVSQTTRTAALCAACLVPAAAGLVVSVVFQLAMALHDPRPAYTYGVFTTGERYVILLALPAIACLGAPLLGVAVGRWLRFPGAALLIAVALALWGMVAGYLPSQGMDASTWPARVLHMLTPYTAWVESNSGDQNAAWVPTVVRSLTGSPAWFAAWTLALCALAACAALLHGAEGHVRQVVLRASWVAGAVALTSLTLAVVTGYSVTHDSSSKGTVVADSRTPLSSHP
jgi:hypothetical protein